MKIIFLIDSLGTGGAEKSMVDLASYLKEKKHEITFCCLDKRQIGYESVIRIQRIEILFLTGTTLYSQIHSFIKVIREINPDIVHSVLYRADLISRLCRPWARNISYVQSMVSTPYSSQRKMNKDIPIVKYIAAKYLDKFSALIFPSFYHFITKTVFEHYRELYNVKGNYRIIYRGRRKNRFICGNPRGKFTLINVGRQEFAKGQINLLKALNFILTNIDCSANIYLEILGFQGRQSQTLETYVKENNLEERVKIHGFVENVEERLAMSDVFVFPSYFEGLGGALIEALAARLPCVCSDIPVLREVIGSRRGALFYDPNDFKELASHIYKLYTDQKLRQDLRDYSYTRYQEVFQIEQVHFEMLKMYNFLILKSDKIENPSFNS